MTISGNLILLILSIFLWLGACYVPQTPASGIMLSALWGVVITMLRGDQLIQLIVGRSKPAENKPENPPNAGKE
jgi:hypothetical protein